jgi:aspartokinase
MPLRASWWSLVDFWAYAGGVLILVDFVELVELVDFGHWPIKKPAIEIASHFTLPMFVKSKN